MRASENFFSLSIGLLFTALSASQITDIITNSHKLIVHSPVILIIFFLLHCSIYFCIICSVCVPRVRINIMIISTCDEAPEERVNAMKTVTKGL